MSTKHYNKWVRRSSHEAPSNYNVSELGRIAIRTQQEVAGILGCSRQAVHQAERKALHIIREGLAEYYKDFLKNH
ncbi:MAG: sigma factor-like helix-turn-helix DNA-binding protein [Verrucomicrobia bacterium]|nr:sigma factor-like helix-turn-helix DNA-binding protein [Verrucomicrobiota bacterium]